MNITGEETQAELEDMLSQFDDTEVTDIDTDDEDSDSENSGQETEGTEPESDSETTQEDPQPSGEPEAEPIILAKDGKSTIPFQVLAGERMEKNQAYQQLAESQAKLAEMQQRYQLLQQQATRAGLTPQDSMEMTPEELSKLSDEYPGMAQSVEKLYAKIEQQSLQVQQLVEQQKRAEKAEAENAFYENATLVGWQQNSPERFQFACRFDEMLMNDPAWAGKPIRERYEAVTRATSAHFGEPQTTQDPGLISKGNQKALEALNSNHLPDSPSQVGSHAGTPKNLNEHLASASDAELQSALSAMSTEQIEDYLAKIGY